MNERGTPIAGKTNAMSTSLFRTCEQSSITNLSPQCQMMWAKTSRDDPSGWLPLYQHMFDSAETARLLWHEWLPESIRHAVADHTGTMDAAEALYVWLACAHDIGKCSPGFQFKSQQFAERVHETGLDIPANVHHPWQHSLMSQVLLMAWLEEHGWYDLPTSRTYAIVVGGHHGALSEPHDEALLRDLLRDTSDRVRSGQRDSIGNQGWRPVQKELLDLASEVAGVMPLLDDWKDKPLPAPLQALLTGAVILADWLASNQELFPLQPLRGNALTTKVAEQAWSHLMLPSAWEAETDLPPDAATLLGERFALPAGSQPNPAQSALVEAARGLDGPGLLIMEAPMGSGKTEAALMAAEVLASRFNLGGVAFLLPTMATSNAMFSRMKAWLDRLPDRRGPHMIQTLKLAHGKSELNPEFADLPHWRISSIGDTLAPGSSNDSVDDVIVHTWLNGRKRALLSSFVVGTVDQLLMAVLRSKHVVLRHLGLAGKVVIVDEAHAYDSYMSVYLHRALAWLGAYQTPVILLSATLPPESREQLIRAYHGHEGKYLKAAAPQRLENGDPAYPLITRTSGGVTRHTACAAGNRHTDVQVEEIPDDDETLLHIVRQATEVGGSVGIIRNTVGRAQATHDLLTTNLDCEIMLAHSRFIACDRQANDAAIIARLGRDAVRESPFVVVGTQVLEQSLDIDFDLMITDIAPIDLVLQRMGRLHRHDRDRPADLRHARCLITGVTDWTQSPPTIVSTITRIYPKALIWRSIAALRHRTDNLTRPLMLPHDIAALVEQVYAEEFTAPDGWQDDLTTADEQLREQVDESTRKAKTWLLPAVPEVGDPLRGWSQAALSDADIDNTRGQAAVRDAGNSIEVVVVQQTADGAVRLLPWINGGDTETSHFTHNSHVSTVLSEAPDSVNDMRIPTLGREITTDFRPDDHVARFAATCTVSLPPGLTVPGVADEMIDWLEQHGHFAGWQESSWLAGQLPLVIDEDNLSPVIRLTDGRGRSLPRARAFRLRYDRERGLEQLTAEEAER